MTFDKSALKKYWTIDEAAQRLSENSDESVSAKDVIGFVLDGHLPLVVYCPTGTRQPRLGSGFPFSNPTVEEGLWDVELEGERGAPARQHLEHLRNTSVSLDGVKGAWVKRADDRFKSGYQYQQLEPLRFVSGIYPTYPSAFPRGCELGVRREALDALLSKEEAITKRAEWSALSILFMNDHTVQVHFADEPARNFNFSNMGFAHAYKGGPKEAWYFLQKFAENNEKQLGVGVIEVPYSKDRRTLESRAKEIRKALRDFVKKEWPGYDIPETSLPVSYRKYTPRDTESRVQPQMRRYETAFTIGLMPSYPPIPKRKKD